MNDFGEKNSIALKYFEWRNEGIEWMFTPVSKLRQ
jgi:hypothetical protein